MVKPVDHLFPITRRAARLPDGNWQVMVTPPSVFAMPTQMVTLTPQQYGQYLLWLGGMKLIQEALPDIPAAAREVLLTGIGNEDFNRIAREDEE